MNGVILRISEIVRAMEGTSPGHGDAAQKRRAAAEHGARERTGAAPRDALCRRLIATMAQTLLLGDVAAEPLMRNLNACAVPVHGGVRLGARVEETAARVSMKNDEVLARMEMQVEGGKNDGGTMD